MPSSIQSAGARCQDRGTGAGLVHCAATGPVSMHRLSPANCALACHPLATARCMQARHPPPVALLPSSSQPPGPVHSVSAKHCSGFTLSECMQVPWQHASTVCPPPVPPPASTLDQTYITSPPPLLLVAN